MTGIDEERAKELILKARAHWFEEQEGSKHGRNKVFRNLPRELKMPVVGAARTTGQGRRRQKQAAPIRLTDQDKARLLDYLRRAHGDG